MKSDRRWWNDGELDRQIAEARAVGGNVQEARRRLFIRRQLVDIANALLGMMTAVRALKGHGMHDVKPRALVLVEGLDGNRDHTGNLTTLLGVVGEMSDRESRRVLEAALLAAERVEERARHDLGRKLIEVLRPCPEEGG